MTPHNYYHELIKNYSKSKRDFFFIQIGSNDGKRCDPIHGHIVRNKWNGILIEPVTYIFKDLINNYHKRGYVEVSIIDRLKNYFNKRKNHFNKRVLSGAFTDRLTFLNVAIAEINGEKDFYRIKKSNDQNNPFWYDQIGSFREEIVLKHKNPVPDFDNRFIKEKVNCITFEELVAQEKIEKIDLINIDTEGYDFEIIKLIDFQKTKPVMILYEHKHITGEEQLECQEYLKEKGYKIIIQAGDTFAYLRDRFQNID